MASNTTFWKGFRLGYIRAWMFAGLPAAATFALMGEWLACGLCIFGFILSTVARP